jgi:hypothetical protein
MRFKARNKTVEIMHEFSTRWNNRIVLRSADIP